jgi:translation initiation factor IF-2
MAVTTVAQFAAQLNRPTTALLEQLQSAGVTKQSPDDALTEADKERCSTSCARRTAPPARERKKITLTRKTTTEIKQADASGKARTIQVEVRKKRVFVKRDDAPAVEEAGGPSAEELDLQRREEEARAQAEAIASRKKSWPSSAASARSRSARREAAEAAAAAAAQRPRRRRSRCRAKRRAEAAERRASRRSSAAAAPPSRPASRRKPPTGRAKAITLPSRRARAEPPRLRPKPLPSRPSPCCAW